MEPVCFFKAGLLSRPGLFCAFERCHKYNSLSRVIWRAARNDKFKVCTGARKHRKFLLKSTGPIVNGCRPNVCSRYVHLYSSSSFLMVGPDNSKSWTFYNGYLECGRFTRHYATTSGMSKTAELADEGS